MKWGCRCNWGCIAGIALYCIGADVPAGCETNDAMPDTAKASAVAASSSAAVAVSNEGDAAGERVPITLSLSAAVPGGGHILNRKYIKGSAFLVSEISFGLVAYNRYLYMGQRNELVDVWRSRTDSLAAVRDMYRDSLAVSATSADSLHFASLLNSSKDEYVGSRQTMELKRYEEMASEREFYNWLCVTALWHCYSLCDALAATGWNNDVRPRDPFIAGLLSAIPFSGGGQIYNGSFSKAGLLFAANGSLTYMAYNYHKLMKHCEKMALRYADTQDEADEDIVLQWKGKQKSAFNLRNVYLWYDIVFYFYGIFDAVVDAHLHDLPVQMHFMPHRQQPTIGVYYTVTY